MRFGCRLPLLYAADGPHRAEIRGLLAGGAPSEQDEIDRVMQLVTEGDYVERVLDEATDRVCEPRRKPLPVFLKPT